MEYGIVRFNEMKRYIGGISYKTLSATLKELETDGLVCRKEYPQVPPKVEYSLTERGKSLIPILDMLQWMPHNAAGTLGYFGSFLAIYAVIWISQYLTIKRRIAQINGKSRRQK